MSGAVTASNFYRSFAASTSPYAAAERSCGHAENAVAVSGRRQHLRTSEPSGRRRLTPTVEGGLEVADHTGGGAAVDTDSRSSEDGDVSVCSLDATDVLLNARQIEAS